MAMVFSLSTLIFVLITGMETSKSLSQRSELKQVIEVASGKDAVLECSVKFSDESPGNVNIEQVVFWRLHQNGSHKGEPLFKYNQQSSNPRMPQSQKYQHAMPPANEKDKVVFLLVKETQPEDEGLYECVVYTDSGNTNCTFMLEVTVRDQVPENAANRKEIPKNSYMNVAAVFVVVGSLAIGLLLLKLFQARRLRQHESLIPEDSVVPEDHRSRDTSHQSSQGHIPPELAGTHPTRARRDTSHQSSQGHIPPELTGTHPTRARRNTSHQTSQGHIPPELTGTHPTRAPRDTSHQTSQGHIPPELTGTHPTRARRDTSRQSSQEQGHIPSVIKHLTRVRFRSC